MSVRTFLGDVLVNKYPRSQSFQRETGYVQQADIHMSISTVRDFSATLRQPKSTPLRGKARYVIQVIEVLEMELYADAVIGIRGEDYCSETHSA